MNKIIATLAICVGMFAASAATNNNTATQNINQNEQYYIDSPWIGESYIVYANIGGTVNVVYRGTDAVLALRVAQTYAAWPSVAVWIVTEYDQCFEY